MTAKIQQLKERISQSNISTEELEDIRRQAQKIWNDLTLKERRPLIDDFFFITETYTALVNMEPKTQYELYGPEWKNEMMNFNKNVLVEMLRSALLAEGSPFDSLQALFLSHGEFSDNTFGKERGSLGPINHLKKEVEELLNAPEDDEEYADCFLLLLDAFRRKGGTIQGLLHAAFVKLDINRRREWGKPDENGVVEHIKETVTKSGIELIAEERARQIEEEFWTSEHDDEHTDASLSLAAATYCLPESDYHYRNSFKRNIFWPWDKKWWKPTPENRIRELQKAGALIASEIDRLQRLYTVCTSCEKLFDLETMQEDDGGNYFCVECYEELAPVMKVEYDDLVRKGEIERG